MLITKTMGPKGPIYFCPTCSRDEGQRLKTGGFWFHWAPGKCDYPKWNRGQPCPMCPDPALHFKWWTPKAEIMAKFAEFTDASARADLAAFREVALEKQAAIEMSMAAAPVKDIDIPVPAGLSYLTFQRAGIAYLAGRNDAILADDMGLGKTVQALGLINIDPSIRNVVVLCPASLVLNWRKEASKWLVRQPRFKIVETLTDIPDPEDEFIVVNYDKFGYKKSAGLVDAFKAREWDLVIADEAHRLKNTEAMRTKNIIGDLLPGKDGRGQERPVTPGWIVRARRKLFMTGTPWLNTPIEVWVTLVAACPKMSLMVPGKPPRQAYWQFAYKWCIVEKRVVKETGREVTVILGGKPSAMPQLQLELRATCMMRRLKSQVLTELPPKTRQVIVLEAEDAKTKAAVKKEGAAFAKNDDAFQRLEADVELAKAGGSEEAYVAAIQKLKSAYKIAFEDMSAVRHEMALAKVPLVIDHVRDLRQNGVDKLIVFAHHRDVIEIMLRRFTEAAPRPAMIIGGQSKKVTDEEKARFEEDPSCKVILCSITATREGHTLTAAQTVVFAELDWVPGNMTQAGDRAHRIGQTGNVLVQHLVVDGSLDSKLIRTLLAKQTIFEAGMNDPLGIEIPVLPTTPPRTMEDEVAKESEDRERAAVALARKYPPASPEERSAAHRAMKILAGVCNSAATRDGAGFNG